MSAILKKPVAKETSLSHGPPMIAVLRQSPPYPLDEPRQPMPEVIEPACPMMPQASMSPGHSRAASQPGTDIK
jgi:hypothetical protein